MVERTEGGFSYELLTQQFKSTVQGQVNDPSRSMNDVREHILETLNLSHRNRSSVSFEEVSEKARAAARSVIQELGNLQKQAAPSVKAGKEKAHGGEER